MTLALPDSNKGTAKTVSSSLQHTRWQTLEKVCGVVRAFGPSAAAAQLEGSKKFVKVWTSYFAGFFRPSW